MKDAYAVREAVAEVIHLDPAEIPDDANLIEIGLGSVEMMRLINSWHRAGLDVSFEELAKDPTVAAWQRHLTSLDCRDEEG